MTKASRKQEQDTLLCSVYSLTNFCLKQCVQPGQFALLDQEQAEKCVAECSSFVIDRRLAVKDKWVNDMELT